MDSYEDFCASILSKLQSEMMNEKSCNAIPAQNGTHSFIFFYDRPVLSPLLNEKQIKELTEYKQRAIQRESKKQIYRKNKFLNQFENLVCTSKAPKILTVPDALEHNAAPFTKPEQNNDRLKHDTAKVTPESTEPFILTGMPPVTPSSEGLEAIKATSVKEKQKQDDVKGEELSLPHLLKRSREFIEKEQSRQGSNIIGSRTVLPFENLSDQENVRGLDVSESCLPSYAPSGHSPRQTSPGPPMSPEPNVTLRPHRGRPRPISACSIFFTYPDDPNQSSIAANGRPQDVLTPNRERRFVGLDAMNSNQCEGLGRFNPSTGTVKRNGRSDTSPVDPEVTSPLFRRRCHTMDSQSPSRHQGLLVERSQERMPQFMAGITPRTPPRVSPTSPMSKSFTRESSMSSFLGLTPGSPSHGQLSFEVGQGGLSPVAGDDGCEFRAVGEHYAVLSPVRSLSPRDGSPRHSPSVQTSFYMWGLNHNAGINRNRLSQVLTAEQQMALCRLCAIGKGFLTRRLLKTEKVKHLCQTVQDTQEFIHSFGASQMSEQDFSLQERVRAQLRAALFDIHDIFFTMTPEERLYLLQQDRDLRTERKLREMEKAKTSKDKTILSAATQKSLDRKKQRVGESPGPSRKAQKTKSPPSKGILRPSQGQNALVSGPHLLRRGSYKKSPEERVLHSERLKKQHSLG